MNHMERILKHIDYLPPFPVTVAKALSLLRQPEVTVDEITEVIKFDQAIATNLLRLCNSSYVGLRRPVTSVREAVVFLGLSHLRRMLVLTGTSPYFEARSPGYEARTGELWRHALAVSVISARLQRCIPGAETDSVFIASLLHDVGKLVLSEFVEDEYERIAEIMRRTGMSFLEAERGVTGTDHAEIGARVLELWRFPGEVVHAVQRHHAPVEEQDAPLDNIVRLADMLAITMGYGTAVDGLAYQGSSAICRRYGIHRDALDAVTENSLDELQKIESMFGFAREV